MAIAATFTSSPQIATFLSTSSSPSSSATFHFNTRFHSLPSFSSINPTKSTKSILFQTKSKLLPIKVVSAAAAVDNAAVDATEQLVSTTDDGVSVIVSALFFTAFIGLSVITIGVIYLAVTDFLQKREKEKFEKEEAANSGKKKKKKRVVRAGPKGFGQKVIESEEDI